MPKKDGLEHTDGGQGENQAVGEPADCDKDEAHKSIKDKHFAGKEGCIKLTDKEEETQTPREAGTEVVASHTVVVVLNEEAETEEEREDCICLASESEEKAIPDSAVKKGKPGATSCRIGKIVEIEVLDGVQQNYGEYCKAAEHIGGIDTRMTFDGICHFRREYE